MTNDQRDRVDRLKNEHADFFALVEDRGFEFAKALALWRLGAAVDDLMENPQNQVKDGIRYIGNSLEGIESALEKLASSVSGIA